MIIIILTIITITTIVINSYLSLSLSLCIYIYTYVCVYIYIYIYTYTYNICEAKHMASTKCPHTPRGTPFRAHLFRPSSPRLRFKSTGFLITRSLPLGAVRVFPWLLSDAFSRCCQRRPLGAAKVVLSESFKPLSFRHFFPSCQKAHIFRPASPRHIVIVSIVFMSVLYFH